MRITFILAVTRQLYLSRLLEQAGQEVSLYYENPSFSLGEAMEDSDIILGPSHFQRTKTSTLKNQLGGHGYKHLLKLPHIRLHTPVWRQYPPVCHGVLQKPMTLCIDFGENGRGGSKCRRCHLVEGSCGRGHFLSHEPAGKFLPDNGCGFMRRGAGRYAYRHGRPCDPGQVEGSAECAPESAPRLRAVLTPGFHIHGIIHFIFNSFHRPWF